MDAAAWNGEKISRIMTGWAIVDADPQKDRALYDYQRRVVDFNLDAARLVGEIAAAGAEVFYFHAKSHTGHVWFNSRIGHKVQALGARDLVAEIIAECRRRGLATVGMFQICLDRYAHLTHPEWRQINQDGASFGSRVCFNHPEYRRYILGLIAEAAGHYALDGVMVDEFDFSGRHGGGIMCYCPHCRALFNQRYGGEPPAAPDWQSPAWRSFVRFRLESLAAMMRDIRQAVKSANPSALLTIVSYSGVELPWQRAQPIDAFCEALDYFSLDTGGAINTPLYARLFRAYSSEKAELIGGMQPFLTWLSGAGALPVCSRALRLNTAMSTVANNLTWNVDICYKPLPADRALDAAVMESYADIAAEIKRRAAWLTGRQESLADLALFYSEDSKIFYGRDEPRLYSDEFMGCFRVLLESGIPFDIAGLRHLRSGGWARYKVVVMPAAACLSEADAAAIRNYVAGGGAVIATFNSSLCDPDGAARGNFALADVFGVDFESAGPGGDYRLKFKIAELKKTAGYGFMRLPSNGPLSAGISETCALLTPALLVRARAGAECAGEFLQRPAGAGRLEQHVPEFASCNCNMGEHGQDYAAVSDLAVLHAFGRGRSVYLAAKFGDLYRATGFAYAKTILTNALRWSFAGRERIVVDGPASIEATAFQDDSGRIIIHLVNFQSAPLRCELSEYISPNVFEPQSFLPARDVRVAYRPDPGDRIKRAYQAPEMRELVMKKQPDGRIICTAPEVESHAMVVLE